MCVCVCVCVCVILTIIKRKCKIIKLILGNRKQNRERINFAYSFKNIPIPTQTIYKLLLRGKIESPIKRMRCKAHFFHQGGINSDNTKNFDLKTRKWPPLYKEMQGFEKDQTNMVKNLKFTHNLDKFQKKNHK